MEKIKKLNKIIIFAINTKDLINFRASLINNLVNKGVIVYALAADYDEASQAIVASLGAIPVRIAMNAYGMNPVREMINLISVISTIKKIEADLILCSFLKPITFGLVAAYIASIPKRIAMIEGLGYVFTDDGVRIQLKRRLLRMMVKFFFRIALNLSTKIILLNRDDLNELTGWGVLKEEKTILLGGIGVDLNDWIFEKPSLDPIQFIFVGRLLGQKGIVEFLNASRKIKNQHREVMFVVLGGLNDSPDCIDESLIKDWVREEVGIWPGYVDVKPWLKQSSVFVLPSYREGVPRSTQEAMAIGRAVITANSPGCRETVVEGINGLLVPVRDDQALAEAMMEFVEDPELIDTMGRESRRLAEEKFDEKITNKRLLEIFYD